MQPANYQFTPGAGTPNMHHYGNQVYMMSVTPQGMPQHQMAYGAQRGMADAGPMMYAGQAQQVMYAPAQPMQAGQRPVQPMMVQLPHQFVNSQQIPMQQGVGYHGTPPQWANNQQSYNSAQQPQSFHPQQQQYKKSNDTRSFPFPGQSVSQSTQPSADRSDSGKRHSSRLTFTDPNTGKNIVFGDPQSTVSPAVSIATTVTDTVRNQSPAGTNVVAAEFAAKVAATLTPAHSTNVDSKTPVDQAVAVISEMTDTAAGVEVMLDVPQHPPGAPQHLPDADVVESRHVSIPLTTVPDTSTTETAVSQPTAAVSVVSDSIKSDIISLTPSTDTNLPSKPDDVAMATVATTTVATTPVASEPLTELSQSVTKQLQPAATKKDDAMGKDTKKKKVPTATLR